MIYDIPLGAIKYDHPDVEGNVYISNHILNHLNLNDVIVYAETHGHKGKIEIIIPTNRIFGIDFDIKNSYMYMKEYEIIDKYRSNRFRAYDPYVGAICTTSYSFIKMCILFPDNKSFAKFKIKTNSNYY